MSAGTLSLMNPEEPHTGNAESERLVYRMLYIEESRLLPLLGRKQLPRGFQELNPGDDGLVAQALARVAGEFERNDALGLESELLALLELVFVRHGGMRPAASASRDGGVTARLCDYLESHYREAVSLEQLAALVQRRVREAKRLLVEGATPIEAALELGFCDQAHFSGTFRRFTGVTPGRFRSATRT